MTAAETVFEALGEVTYAPAMTFHNLSLVPLVAAHEQAANYAVLDEALARGWIELTESSDGGQVHELNVVNSGDVAVLLLDGEELLGAKQNRVLNLTVLIPPRHSTVLPVSCVEAGRWRRTSSRFQASPRTQFAEGRAAKMQQVSDSLAASGGHRSNQQAMWQLIAQKSARLNAASDTSAMSAMFDKLGPSLDEFVAAFPALERQVGAIFLVNGRDAGLELFDAASTWRKLAPKLVRSYALDAIDRQQQDVHASPTAARALMQALLSSTPAVFPAVGEGEDVRLQSADLAGAALVAGGRAVHVSAFPTAGAN